MQRAPQKTGYNISRGEGVRVGKEVSEETGREGVSAIYYTNNVVTRVASAGDLSSLSVAPPGFRHRGGGEACCEVNMLL